jgi:hypothetical protein
MESEYNEEKLKIEKQSKVQNALRFWNLDKQEKETRERALKLAVWERERYVNSHNEICYWRK